MKSYKVYKQLEGVPDLLGLPIQAGIAFLGLSMGIFLLCLLIRLPLGFKLICMAGFPALLYGSLRLFCSVYPGDTFMKQLVFPRIEVIRNRCLAVFRFTEKQTTNGSK